MPSNSELVSPTPPARRNRLLSENELPQLNDLTACSVEDVLRLLQLLYAIARDANIQNNALGKWSTDAHFVCSLNNVIHIVSV